MELLGLSGEAMDFIRNHADEEPENIVLAGKDVAGYPAAFLAEQIRARQRQKKRLPGLCADSRIIFPPSINLEQCSSEATARIKCELLQEWNNGEPGNHLTDLSTGFGVDAVAFSGFFRRLSLVEPDEALLAVCAHNFRLIGKCPVDFHNSTALEFLRSEAPSGDWFYVDPSRRKNGRRVYDLADSEPDLKEILPHIFQRNPEADVLVKVSPMADITQLLRTVSGIVHLAVVSISNECRELLLHIRRAGSVQPEILCLNLLSDGRLDRFGYSIGEERDLDADFSEPKTYLFEPNAAIQKAGAIRLLAHRSGLSLLDNNTQLLTGSSMPDAFPGRILEILRPLRDSEPGLAADILVRNHPLHPNEVARHFGFVEGGDPVVVAFRAGKKKFVVLTRRVVQH